ncbi:flagellar assembly protein FliW [Metaclostridioides mangenotii]|uniref:Flagellar assembly factor FliW n=1 Tax=Metaclostridioides mangenotii TaxID=1540 RepID=A0ABS4ECK1_9FIRM|nr:flagellar assembly protein FliW [Clostridioides mangenotii]MBP1855663.1 flagellar assembly factor FliW [Clostridioides mangenotii]
MNVEFRKPLLGFDNLNKFEILDVEANPLFKEINSTEDENISFLSISPFAVDEDYEIDLSDSDIEDLEIENPEDVILLNIITLGESLDTSTVNMRAPIVLNINKELASQIVIQNDKYDIRTPFKLRGDK